MTNRRRFLTASLSTTVLAGVGLAAEGRADDRGHGAHPSSRPSPVPARAPQSEADWLQVLHSHRNMVSLEVRDVRGRVLVSHRADVAQQAASSIKVFHLAAYAEAVALGRLRPDRRVPVRDWERFYYPADGGAHAAALKRLGVSTVGTRAVAVAADPHASVRLDDLVSAMIRESDNAAADYLRALLGPAAIARATARVGARRTRVTSLLGSLIQATQPAYVGHNAERLATRYVSDPAFAQRIRSGKAAPYAVEARYLATGHGVLTSARDLTRMYDAVGSGRIVGASTTRRHLEWQPATKGVVLGFKGGSLPGVLTMGFERRSPATGGYAPGAIMMSGLDERTASATNMDWQVLVAHAQNDPAYAAKVAAALR